MSQVFVIEKLSLVKNKPFLVAHLREHAESVFLLGKPSSSAVAKALPDVDVTCVASELEYLQKAPIGRATVVYICGNLGRTAKGALARAVNPGQSILLLQNVSPEDIEVIGRMALINCMLDADLACLYALQEYDTAFAGLKTVMQSADVKVLSVAVAEYLLSAAVKSENRSDECLLNRCSHLFSPLPDDLPRLALTFHFPSKGVRKLSDSLLATASLRRSPLRKAVVSLLEIELPIFRSLVNCLGDCLVGVETDLHEDVLRFPSFIARLSEDFDARVRYYVDNPAKYHQHMAVNAATEIRERLIRTLNVFDKLKEGGLLDNHGSRGIACDVFALQQHVSRVFMRISSTAQAVPNYYSQGLARMMNSVQLKLTLSAAVLIKQHGVQKAQLEAQGAPAVKALKLQAGLTVFKLGQMRVQMKKFSTQLLVQMNNYAGPHTVLKKATFYVNGVSRFDDLCGDFTVLEACQGVSALLNFKSELVPIESIFSEFCRVALAGIVMMVEEVEARFDLRQVHSRLDDLLITLDALQKRVRMTEHYGGWKKINADLKKYINEIRPLSEKVTLTTNAFFACQNLPSINILNRLLVLSCLEFHDDALNAIAEIEASLEGSCYCGRGFFARNGVQKANAKAAVSNEVEKVVLDSEKDVQGLQSLSELLREVKCCCSDLDALEGDALSEMCEVLRESVKKSDSCAAEILNDLSGNIHPTAILASDFVASGMRYFVFFFGGDSAANKALRAREADYAARPSRLI